MGGPWSTAPAARGGSLGRKPRVAALGVEGREVHAGGITRHQLHIVVGAADAACHQELVLAQDLLDLSQRRQRAGEPMSRQGLGFARTCLTRQHAGERMKTPNPVGSGAQGSMQVSA